MDALERELDAFAASAWGRATSTRESANGLCKRATLALLARLEMAGLADGIELYNLTCAVEGEGRGPAGHNTHWILVRGDDLIDVSARQFDDNAPQIRRGAVQDELSRWRRHERVDPDDDGLWDPCGPLRITEIPPYWRDLVGAAPPGDLPGWPYPRHRLPTDSAWHSPATR